MSKTKKFLQLEQELKGLKDILNRASNEMRDQDLTNYPIFVVHQQELELGVKIVDKDKTKSLWDVHASTLEEFAYKNLIHPEKIEEFKEVYKNPDDFFCFFVISELGAQFIFLPAI